MKRYIYAALCSVALLKAAPVEKSYNYFLQGEFGASFAMNPNFCVNTSTGNWDVVPEGYNASLGAAPLVGFGFGFSPQCHPWLALGFSAALRSNFKFCKFQSGGALLQERRAYLNVDNTSYMFNLFFNKGSQDPYWSYDFCYARWMPFAGFGVGLARNTLFNFHSIKTPEVVLLGVTYRGAPTIMPAQVDNRFAWQIQIGVDGLINESIEFGISYRFFDAGTLRTNNYLSEYLYASEGETHHQLGVPAWCGKFRTNELVFNLGFQF